MDNDCNGLRWGARRIDGTLTMVAAEDGRAVCVEVASDLRCARIRIGAVIGGAFVVEHDATTETICRVEAIESAEQLPLFDDDDSGIHLLAGPVRALPRDVEDEGFGSSSVRRSA